MKLTFSRRNILVLKHLHHNCWYFLEKEAGGGDTAGGGGGVVKEVTFMQLSSVNFYNESCL